MDKNNGKDAGLRNDCLVLYALYGISAFLQFFETTLLMGLLTLFIAYVGTLIKQSSARGTAYASHLRWMLRTFWIGTAILLPIAVGVGAALILKYTDILSVVNAADDPERLMAAIQNYLAASMDKATRILLAVTVPPTAWWVRRCWAGFLQAQAGQPVDRVTSWL